MTGRHCSKLGRKWPKWPKKNGEQGGQTWLKAAKKNWPKVVKNCQKVAIHPTCEHKTPNTKHQIFFCQPGPPACLTPPPPRLETNIGCFSDCPPQRHALSLVVLGLGKEVPTYPQIYPTTDLTCQLTLLPKDKDTFINCPYTTTKGRKY